VTGFAKFQPCSGCCGACAACSGAVPTQLQVVTTGIADTGWCSDCDPDYNDTFVLDPEPGDTTNCYWRYDFGTPPCGSSSYYWVRRTESPVGTWWLICDLVIDGGAHVEWRKSYAAKPNCSVSGEVLTHNPATGYICDGSASTCTITTL